MMSKKIMMTQEYPNTYCSIRLTTPHENKNLVIELFKEEEWCMVYEHVGSNGDNQHFHILIPGSSAKDSERYRKRIKKAGYSGNRQLSIVLNQNGLACGIQYCSHEGTEPYARGDRVNDWILNAPAWDPKLREQKSNTKKRKLNEDGYRISVVNVVRLAFNYRKENNLHSDDIHKILVHMLNSGKYYIEPSFARSGAPDFYKEVFRDSVEADRIRWNTLPDAMMWRPPNCTRF